VNFLTCQQWGWPGLTSVSAVRRMQHSARTVVGLSCTENMRKAQCPVLCCACPCSVRCCVVDVNKVPYSFVKEANIAVSAAMP